MSEALVKCDSCGYIYNMTIEIIKNDEVECHKCHCPHYTIIAKRKYKGRYKNER